MVYPHYLGPGWHMFLDVAVADPGTAAALAASPSSSASAGVAAEQRTERKRAKYGPLAAYVSSEFRAAVMERYGACCDSLVGWSRSLCGEGDRDPVEWEDYSFSAASRIRAPMWRRALVVFAGVIGDACMIDRVIGVDACATAPGRYASAAPRQRGRPAMQPGQREVEGIGGQFCYEMTGGGGYY